MPVQKTITLYSVDELSEKARERAHLDYIVAGLYDEWWYEGVYSYFRQIAELIGIEVSDINFSGFARQGGGARFLGTYTYKPSCIAEIKAYAPQDEELHQIVRDLVEAQWAAHFELKVEIYNSPSSGNYVHEHTVGFEVLNDVCHLSETAVDTAVDGIAEAMRELMRWLYRQLEKEYDHITSMDYFVDVCEANEWLFDENGDLHG